MKNVHEVRHPLIKDLVTRLRNVETESDRFRAFTKSATNYLIYEALADMQTAKETVTTQTRGKYKGDKLRGKIRFFGVLREGISMMNVAMDIFPEAEFDLVGVKRNDDDPFNEKANVYLNKFKDLDKGVERVVLMDQMLATGGTMIVLLDSLINEYKFEGEVDIISMIVAKIGAENILKRFPDVKITCAGF
ncbi:uracil phosphoribosyltransferase, partial [Candidatus Dojkabacteria bacterium]|nr:uracil phosphoribosyltransferase [Candidatus Dojkabacteria bacterium]